MVKWKKMGAAAGIVLAVAAARPAPGSVTDVTLSGSNLSELSLERASLELSYDASQFVGITLQDLRGNDGNEQARLFVPGASAPAAGARSSVIEDLALDTGFNNIDYFTAAFNTPLVNSAGADLLLFDWGSSDAVSVTINGQTISYGAGAFVQNATGSLATNIRASNVAVTSKAILESASTTFSQVATSNATVSVLAIDLSDFGVALHASAGAVHVQDDNTPSSFDPLAVVGLPSVPDLVDDFQQLTYGPGGDIHGVSGWTVASAPTAQVVVNDPADSANRVLRVADQPADIYHAANLADGGAGTLQFNLYIPSEGGNSPDVGVGLTAEQTPAAANELAALVRINGTSLQSHDGSDGAGNGGTFKTLTSLSADTWYTVKLAIDLDLDAYQVLIKGGSFSDFTLLSSAGDDLFGFRNGAGASDLVNFYIRTNGAHDGDVLLIDDVFVSTAAIPEPAAAALLLGGAGCAMRRRRGGAGR